MIVDKTELSTSQDWSNIDSAEIGPSAQSSWDGLSNSYAIVAQSGHTHSAVALCLNSNNGGQSDWYLPSIDELNLLWLNRFSLNRTFATITGATLIQKALYWSSSEGNFEYARVVGYYMNNLYDAEDLKYSLAFVRAIRAF